MFSLDPRYRGIPAHREQVLALYQSINAPHLAIPGKQAGPAQGFVVGLRAGAASAVFVYLYLRESLDCAVYVSGKRCSSQAEFEAEAGDALGFVESMGFMMDDARFAEAPPEQQDELLRTLPVFFKDPKVAPKLAGGKNPGEDKRTAAAQLGRLLAAF